MAVVAAGHLLQDPQIRTLTDAIQLKSPLIHQEEGRYNWCCMVIVIVCVLAGICLATLLLLWVVTSKTPALDVYLSHLRDLYGREPEVPTIQVMWRDTHKKVEYIEPVMKESKPLCGEEHLGIVGLPKAEKELLLVDVFGDVEVGRGSRMIVHGKPGSGKNTLLQKLTKMWIGGKALTQCRVLLKIQLRRSANKNIDCLANEDALLWDLFSLCGIIADPAIDLDAVISEANLGEVCIALDGLDEYVPQNHVADPDSLLYRLITGEDALPLSTVMVTSRPTALHEDYLHGPLVLRRIEIVGLDKQGITSFVHSYFGQEKARATKLVKDIEGNPDILFTCYNPLLLTFLVYAFDLGEKLPQTETGVHVAFITAFLKQEVRRIDKKVYLRRECQYLKLSSFENVNKCSSVLGKLFQAVSRLAYEGTFDARVTVTSADGSVHELALIKTDFAWDEVPEELLQYSFGFVFGQPIYASPLNPYGMSEVHSFHHLVIQEFLAAFYVTQMHPERQKVVLENAVTHQSADCGRYYCGLFGVSVHDKSLLKYYVSISPYGDAIDCAFQSQSTTIANEVIAVQNYHLDCINFLVMEWPVGGDSSTDMCPPGMEYCSDPNTVNPVVRSKWDFLVTRTSASIQRVSFHISWSCLFLYCSIVHALESTPATELEVETFPQFPQYMPRCLKDEEKQREVMSLTVESAVQKAPSLEHITIRGTWMTNVDVVWTLTELHASGYLRRLHVLTIVNYEAELLPYHTGVVLGGMVARLPGLKRLTVISSPTADMLKESANVYIALVLSTWQSQALANTLKQQLDNSYVHRFSIHLDGSEYYTEVELTRI